MTVQRVVVISGGATEHDVSVASGRDVCAALIRDRRYSVIEVHVDRNGMWRVGGPTAAVSKRSDVLDSLGSATVVFPVLHGGWGEGGGLQRELEGRRVPFVGSGADASARCLSKAQTLRICAQAGIGVVPTLPLDRVRFLADPDLVTAAIRRAANGRIVIKPDTGGSSIGVHFVPPAPLRVALNDVFERDRVALVQPAVAGREVSVGVWTPGYSAPRATGGSLLHLPAGADEEGFTYAHKYQHAGAVLEIPAPFPPRILAGLQDASLRCFAALGCRGMARVDFFVDHDERILLNEVNTIPGLRRDSHFPRLVCADGTSYDLLLRQLIDGALCASRSAIARPTAQGA